jgi:hypothetical protein
MCEGVLRGERSQERGRVQSIGGSSTHLLFLLQQEMEDILSRQRVLSSGSGL